MGHDVILLSHDIWIAGNYRSALNDCIAARKFKPDHIKAIIKGIQHYEQVASFLLRLFQTTVRNIHWNWCIRNATTSVHVFIMKDYVIILQILTINLNINVSVGSLLLVTKLILMFAMWLNGSQRSRVVGMNTSARGWSVRLFEWSDGLDTALYKNIPFVR